jgi:nitrile hydratase subunit alpha
MAEHEHHHEPPEPNALRAAALEALLVEKGLVQPEAIDAIIRRYEEEIGPMNGAKVVARAWVDPEYRRRLLANAPAAVAELGFGGPSDPPLVVVENQPAVQNVIVCTLCSCYPSRLLGLPPSWYKSFAYRSRVVREPRRVLAEMGLPLGEDVEIRVWDSSAELRYMVLPERPAGTEGLSEEELAALVSRDALIGVARARTPGRDAAEASHA